MLGLLWALSAHAAAPGDNEIEIGRRIYQDGVLPTGAPLTGARLGGGIVSGAEAACMTCHRRSGMGSVEGDIQVSPISGNYLFGTGEKTVATMDPHSGKAFNQKHPPYTDDSLATAIRTGTNNRGHSMNPVMPRYVLNDSEMKALTAYLRQLSTSWSPGVTANTIRFATVITPDVEEVRRQALISTLRNAFAQKNGATLPGRRYMAPAAEMMLGTGRKWELDVWALQGAPETWGGQLEAHYRSRPVFALVSGTSNSTWAPVDAFCQKEHVPCWFPSIDLPPSTSVGGGFYSVYFSRGVTLEAEVLAKYLQGDHKPHKVVQVFRDDYVGRGAARALTQALSGSGITVDDRVLSVITPETLTQALNGVRKRDAVMFWLRPDDLAVLGKVRPPQATTFFSAELARNDGASIPAAWQQKARLLYPYELPKMREANLSYFNAWLRLRRLPLVDERLQSEAYFALDFLTDTVSDMLNNLYGDYLLERAEDMIVRREGEKAEGEVWQVSRVSYTPAPLARRDGTSIYPRLSLGPGQRFASKGAYVVRFDGGNLVSDSTWIVP